MVDDNITTTKQNQKGVHILWDIPLKLKSCHDANFVNIGSTRGCHDDNLWCCQWWQNSNLSYDANVVPTTSTVGCHNNTHGVAGHNKILTWELSLCQLRYHWQHQIMIYSGVTNDDKIKTPKLSWCQLSLATPDNGILWCRQWLQNWNPKVVMMPTSLSLATPHNDILQCRQWWQNWKPKLSWCQLRYHWQHHIMTSSGVASDDKIETQKLSWCQLLYHW